MCSSVPNPSIMAPAPRVSMRVRDNETLEPLKNSLTAVPTVSGRPMPPNSGLARRPIQPPSQTVLIDGFEGLRQGDLAVGVLGADAVAVLVAGRHLLLGDLEGLVEDHLDVFVVPVGEFLRLEQFRRARATRRAGT